MNIKKICKMFENGNVSVSGLRGTGKDMLMSNVACRRKKPYISNVDYGGQYMPINFDLLNCGGNTYDNFIKNDIKKYVYPYCDGADVYISDAGVYFPSQYNDQLDRKYPHFSTFSALSRHLGECNVHYNAQRLGRVWLKFREQSDIYIKCKFCKVLFGKIVIQKIMLYEKYDSADNDVQIFRMKNPHGLFAPREAKANFKSMYLLKKQEYINTHGVIKKHWLIYINRSKYNTRRFKEMMLNGKDNQIQKLG